MLLARADNHAFQNACNAAAGRRVKLDAVGGDDLTTFERRVLRLDYLTAQPTFHNSARIAGLTILENR